QRRGGLLRLLPRHGLLLFVACRAEHSGTDARQRRHAGRLERIEPEDVARPRRVDDRARLARSGLERPHAHVRYRGPAERQPLTFDQLWRAGEREVQAVRGAVQPAAVGLVRGQPVQSVGARIHDVQMRTLELDRNEDVANAYRIALGGVDPDEVHPELGEHRLAEHPRGEAAHRRGERGYEPGAGTLGPPEVAAPRAGARVGGLPLRDVLELGLASRDLGPQRAGVRQGRGAVGGVRDARQFDVADPGGRGSLEFGLVRAVVTPELRVRHRRERVRHVFGVDGEQRYRHRFVLVTPDAP